MSACTCVHMCTCIHIYDTYTGVSFEYDTKMTPQQKNLLLHPGLSVHLYLVYCHDGVQCCAEQYKNIIMFQSFSMASMQVIYGDSTHREFHTPLASQQHETKCCITTCMAPSRCERLFGPEKLSVVASSSSSSRSHRRISTDFSGSPRSIVYNLTSVWSILVVVKSHKACRAPWVESLE